VATALRREPVPVAPHRPFLGGSPRGLHALAPIGLAELDAHASLQDRVDVKYIVTFVQLEALFERLSPTHRALEIDGRRSFAYRTTYYDTDDLLTFREHVQQRRRRFKCRKRRYVAVRGRSSRSSSRVREAAPSSTRRRAARLTCSLVTTSPSSTRSCCRLTVGGSPGR